MTDAKTQAVKGEGKEGAVPQSEQRQPWEPAAADDHQRVERVGGRVSRDPT